MTQTYRKTIAACMISYISQAALNNFAPLLFLTFQRSYGIPLTQITVLVTVNFMVQLLVDLLSVGFADRLGYRASMVAAHALAAAGLCGLAILPDLFHNPFLGLLTAVMIHAVGAGLMEVLISPIVESCPTTHKEKAMSLVHSCYSWGVVGVVLLSTAFFAVFGIENWKFMAVFWALIPLGNAFLFARVPIISPADNDEPGLSLRELLRQKTFWLMFLMMLCSGASEMSVSQWASAMAERGLGVSKAVGDLAGPMAFAALMGTSRVFYARNGERLNLGKFMTGSVTLCLVCYLLMGLTRSPILGLIGCALSGMAVGMLWPGTFCTAAACMKRGGTAMFALLALGGDLGCSAGPTLVGFVSGMAGDNLKAGILAGIVFPALLLAGVLTTYQTSNRAGRLPPRDAPVK